VILKHTRHELPDGSVVDGKPRYADTIPLPLPIVCETLGKAPAELWNYELQTSDIVALVERAKKPINPEEAA
jgi:hypothetical protein